MSQPAFVRAYPPGEIPEGPALWFAVQGADLLVRECDGKPVVLQGAADEALAGLSCDGRYLIGALDGVPCVAVGIADGLLPDGLHKLGIRALFGRMDPQHYAIAGYAVQMVYWQRTSGFCANCGGRTRPNRSDWGKRCTVCGHTTYPRVSPCIITVVHNGDYVLLAHMPGRGPVYSLIAGFVEPGESLEDCLRREVREEVGLEVEDIQYFASQPWPFPHQLMCGFFARYSSGEIRIQDTELDGARWFHVSNLPQLPGKLSIARQLLDHWIRSRGGTVTDT